MKAMILKNITNINDNRNPLVLKNIPIPKPKKDELLIKVSTCGVCHTELDEIEGRTPPSFFPIILGHQIVGRIINNNSKYKIGERVGIAWIFSACGKCKFCLSNNENLCRNFKATGRDVNGGYAEYITVSENFVYKIPKFFTDSQAAPLLCAGAIGYRSLKLTALRESQTIGLTGFGASGHLVLKMIKYKFPNVKIFVFARSKKEREFSKTLGAFWVGKTDAESPTKLDCIIDTTPAWKPVIEALKNLESGGRLVINAIRKEKTDLKYLLNLQYEKHLWMEKEIKSVANITRSDVSEFLNLAVEMKIKPELQEYSLNQANIALYELKTGEIKGAKVLNI